MRGKAAKRLRAEARRLATERGELKPTLFGTLKRFAVVVKHATRGKYPEAPIVGERFEGAVRYRTGFRRIYRDLKRRYRGRTA